jgi:hypothetical protein
MKTYKITFKGGHKVSLVKDPAIEETLLKFSAEQEEKLYFANDEKRVVYSVAMIPNKLIFRKDINGEPAQVFYDEQAIEDFQQQYFRKQDLSTNINHAQFNTDGIFPFESWIVANSENDKSKHLGLNAPNGSLVMGFKIENDAIWNDVKEGKLDGLSIEGFTRIEEVTTKTINMNTEKNPQTLWDTLKAFFAVETPAEKTPEEIAAEASKEAEDTPTETAEQTLQKQVDELTAENEALKAELANLKAEQVKAETEMTTMKSEKETMTTEIEKLKGEIVEVKMIKNVPQNENLADIPYEKMTNKQKVKFNREN